MTPARSSEALESVPEHIKKREVAEERQENDIAELCVVGVGVVGRKRRKEEEIDLLCHRQLKIACRVVGLLSWA